jgi:hypothetical protein
MRGRFRRCASQQGNALWSVLRLGIADDRADVLAERLLHWQWPDGGWNCDRDPAADTSSFNETWIPMRALAIYAQVRHDLKAKRAMDRAAELFLTRKMLWRRSNGALMQRDFAALHYPHYWHYDILAGLIAISEVGKIRDRRCAAALDLLEEKRLRDGGWPAEKRYFTISPKSLVSNADYVRWGPTGRSRMNEWVTVEALTVLRAAGRLRN